MEANIICTNNSGRMVDTIIGDDVSQMHLDLNKMTGYGGDTPWHNEPFQLILYHSNCEGQYSVNQLHLLLQEVKEIKKLKIDYNDQSNKFIRLITHAITVKKPLEFW